MDNPGARARGGTLVRSAPLIFLGILVGLAASWWGVIVVPNYQVGRATTVLARSLGAHYPPTRPGLARQGAEVYRREGCNTCHSQLVRPAGFGYDIGLGWGPRRTVAQDYLRDEPVMLGTVRVGPDLANIGTRMGAGDTNAEPALVAYHLRHLYHPRTVMPNSVMPAYPYLFEKRRISGSPSLDALQLAGEYAPEPGYEVVPTPEVLALVAYLLSLQAGVSLPEAPVAPPATNVVDETGNLPAAEALRQ
jgi:cytochrome c oxidase cbb3-type subunit 2